MFEYIYIAFIIVLMLNIDIIKGPINRLLCVFLTCHVQYLENNP